MKVGFIGLGQMGSGMAANLLKAGHQVSVYNRTAGKTANLVRMGAQAPAEISAVCQSEAVMTMLANDEAVESTVFADAGIEHPSATRHPAKKVSHFAVGSPTTHRSQVSPFISTLR